MNSSQDHAPAANAAAETRPLIAQDDGITLFDVGSGELAVKHHTDRYWLTFSHSMSSFGLTDEQTTAIINEHAKLFAAAPDLLDVVQELLDHSEAHYGQVADETYGVGLVQAMARAAIRKATGAA